MGDGLGALRGSNSLADRVIQTDDTVLVSANLVEPEDSRNGGYKRGVEKRTCPPGVFVSTVCESATGNARMSSAGPAIRPRTSARS
jgi:hypothetical protein